MRYFSYIQFGMLCYIFFPSTNLLRIVIERYSVNSGRVLVERNGKIGSKRAHSPFYSQNEEGEEGEE